MGLPAETLVALIASANLPPRFRALTTNNHHFSRTTLHNIMLRTVDGNIY